MPATPEVAAQNAAEKEKALATIRAMGKSTFTHIAFYNAIENAETLPDGITAALEQQKALYDSLLNYNALLSGFTFVGLPLDNQPETAIQVAAYFSLIMGFFLCLLGALMAFIATLFIAGMNGETWDCVSRVYFKWVGQFYYCQFLAVGGSACLAIAINILVHDLFMDREPITCLRGDEAQMCNPPAFLGYIVNVLSFIAFLYLPYLFLGSILAKHKGRKLFVKKEP